MAVAYVEADSRLTQKPDEEAIKELDREIARTPVEGLSRFLARISYALKFVSGPHTGYVEVTGVEPKKEPFYVETVPVSDGDSARFRVYYQELGETPQNPYVAAERFEREIYEGNALGLIALWEETDAPGPIVVSTVNYPTPINE